MKVVIKSRNDQARLKVKEYFLEHIFPILENGIAFEEHLVDITIIKKSKSCQREVFNDLTAEVVVELSELALDYALDKNASIDEIKHQSGNFFDEAKAIREIEKFPRKFSVEYHLCKYSPAG